MNYDFNIKDIENGFESIKEMNADFSVKSLLVSSLVLMVENQINIGQVKKDDCKKVSSEMISFMVSIMCDEVNEVIKDI